MDTESTLEPKVISNCFQALKQGFIDGVKQKGGVYVYAGRTNLIKHYLEGVRLATHLIKE